MHTIEAADGTPLAIRRWVPEDPPRAEIVVLHGLGEHSGRYRHVGERLAAAGFGVTAPDLRGFGASGGIRAYVDEVETFLSDLDPIVEEAAGGAPVVLLGHSMGGLLALRYAQTRGGPDLLILSSPALGADIPAYKLAASRLLRRLLPRFSFLNGITGEQLSRDPAVGEAYFGDPYVHTKTTAALAGALLEAIDFARDGGIPIPALVIHGEEDTFVPASVSAPLGDLPGVTRITFPEFRHESFNEDGGEEALGTVVDWIEQRLGTGR